MKNKDEINKKLREYRRKTDNKATKKYEKTKKGFLMRTYRNMKSRINGVQKKKHHLYEGKYLLAKEEFYAWSLQNDDFHNLFDTWEKSSYLRTLSPSIDRINSDLGYSVDNMRWVTHSVNSKNGSINAIKKLNVNNQQKAKLINSINYLRNDLEWSYKDISEYCGVPYNTINAWCKKSVTPRETLYLKVMTRLSFLPIDIQLTNTK